jgi:hypothetical protein
MRTNKFNILRYLSVTSLLLLLVMSVTGCSDEAAPTDSYNENQSGVLSKNPVIHRVSVGGADVCEALGLPTGCDANFSLVAIQKEDGSVSGQWQDTFPGGSGGIHVAVDCMEIVGNGAVISGVITHGNFNGVDVSGQRAITAVVDNGTSANDPADQLSFSFFPDNTDCTTVIPGNFPLFALAHGQVKVR